MLRKLYVYFPFSEAEPLNCRSVRAVGPPRKLSFPTWFGQIEGVPSSRNWLAIRADEQIRLDVGLGKKCKAKMEENEKETPPKRSCDFPPQPIN